MRAYDACTVVSASSQLCFLPRARVAGVAFSGVASGERERAVFRLPLPFVDEARLWPLWRLNGLHNLRSAVEKAFVRHEVSARLNKWSVVCPNTTLGGGGNIPNDTSSTAETLYIPQLPNADDMRPD